MTGNFSKQYILGCISFAGNNLKLTSDKIEKIKYLKKIINSEHSIEKIISNLKKLTIFSKFGIKLGEILEQIEVGNLDFLNMTSNFKNHSHNLVIPLKELLEDSNREALLEVSETFVKKKETRQDFFLKPFTVYKDHNFNELKIDKIIENIKEFSVEFEKSLDFSEWLKKILSFQKTFNLYKQIFLEIGFITNANMLSILELYLFLYEKKVFKVYKEELEEVRAVLIVVLAISKDKKADIIPFIKKAEAFGMKLSEIYAEIL